MDAQDEVEVAEAEAEDVVIESDVVWLAWERPASATARFSSVSGRKGGRESSYRRKRRRELPLRQPRRQFAPAGEIGKRGGKEKVNVVDKESHQRSRRAQNAPRSPSSPASSSGSSTACRRSDAPPPSPNRRLPGEFPSEPPTALPGLLRRRACRTGRPRFRT